VIDDQPMSRITPALAIKLGVALVPEDRHVQGLVLDHSIERNQILPRLPQFSATQTLERYSKGVVEERRMQPATTSGPHCFMRRKPVNR
jgi:ABC-type sugar transport system ATPase subunit